MGYQQQPQLNADIYDQHSYPPQASLSSGSPQTRSRGPINNVYTPPEEPPFHSFPQYSPDTRASPFHTTDLTPLTDILPDYLTPPSSAGIPSRPTMATWGSSRDEILSPSLTRMRRGPEASAIPTGAIRSQVNRRHATFLNCSHTSHLSSVRIGRLCPIRLCRPRVCHAVRGISAAVIVSGGIKIVHGGGEVELERRRCGTAPHHPLTFTLGHNTLHNPRCIRIWHPLRYSVLIRLPCSLLQRFYTASLIIAYHCSHLPVSITSPFISAIVLKCPSSASARSSSAYQSDHKYNAIHTGHRQTLR